MVIFDHLNFKIYIKRDLISTILCSIYLFILALDLGLLGNKKSDTIISLETSWITEFFVVCFIFRLLFSVDYLWTYAPWN